MARTTRRGISHRTEPHVRQNYVSNTAPCDRLRTWRWSPSLQRSYDLASSLRRSEQLVCGRGLPRGGTLPRPKRWMDIVLASRLWPDLIIQPQPLSDENPPWSTSWLFTLIWNERADRESGSEDLGIGSKSERYVIQSLDSKSSKKAAGHPPWLRTSRWSDDGGMSVCSESDAGSNTLAGMSVSGCVCGIGRNTGVGGVGGSDGRDGSWGGFSSARVYGRPRHQTGWSRATSFVGSGSQNIWTMRLYLPKSTVAMWGGSSDLRDRDPSNEIGLKCGTRCVYKRTSCRIKSSCEMDEIQEVMVIGAGREVRWQNKGSGAAAERRWCMQLGLIDKSSAEPHVDWPSANTPQKRDRPTVCSVCGSLNTLSSQR